MHKIFMLLSLPFRIDFHSCCRASRSLHGTSVCQRQWRLLWAAVSLGHSLRLKCPSLCRATQPLARLRVELDLSHHSPLWPQKELRNPSNNMSALFF